MTYIPLWSTNMNKKKFSHFFFPKKNIRWVFYLHFSHHLFFPSTYFVRKKSLVSHIHSFYKKDSSFFLLYDKLIIQTNSILEPATVNSVQVIDFSKFYGKVSVISWFLFHLIWKNYVLYWYFNLKSWIVDFFTRFTREKTPQQLSQSKFQCRK